MFEANSYEIKGSRVYPVKRYFNWSGVNIERFKRTAHFQLRSNWCWTAELTNTLRFYGVAIKQRQLAAYTCDVSFRGIARNCPATATQMNDHLNLCDFDLNGKLYCAYGSFYDGRPSAEWVLNQLEAGRTIIVGLKGNSIGHAVTLLGAKWNWVNGERVITSLVYHDPASTSTYDRYNGIKTTNNARAFIKSVYVYFEISADVINHEVEWLD